MNKKGIIILGVVILVVLAWYFVKSYSSINNPLSNNSTTNQVEDKTLGNTVSNTVNESNKSVIPNSNTTKKPANDLTQTISGVCSLMGTKIINWAIFSESHLVGTATAVAGSPTIITDGNRTIEFRKDDLPVGAKVYYCSIAPRISLPFIGSAMAVNISGVKKDDQIPFTITTTGVPMESTDSLISVYDFVQFQHWVTGKDTISFGWGKINEGVMQKVVFFKPDVIHAVFNVKTGMSLLAGYIEVPQY